MKNEFQFFCFLSNQWSRCIIRGVDMESKWVHEVAGKWILTDFNEGAMGRFDKIWNDYEPRFNAHRAKREQG